MIVSVTVNNMYSFPTDKLSEEDGVLIRSLL